MLLSIIHCLKIIGIAALLPCNFSALNKLLSYRRETALQSALVLAKSGRLELGDNILQTL